MVTQAVKFILRDSSFALHVVYEVERLGVLYYSSLDNSDVIIGCLVVMNVSFVVFKLVI